MDQTTNSHKSYTWLAYCLGILIVTLFIHNLLVVKEHAVDLPAWEEWWLFPQLETMSFSKLFSLHNGHIQAMFKAQIWALYLINGWDIASHYFIGYIQYGFLLLALFFLSRSIAPNLNPTVILAFLLFFLSAHNHELFNAPVNTSWTVSLLFLTMGIYFIFRKKQTWKFSLFAGFLLGLSMMTLGVGLIAAPVVLLVYSIYRVSNSTNASRSNDVKQLLVAWSIPIALGVLWKFFLSDSRSVYLETPLSLDYWKMFSRMLALSIGFDDSLNVPKVLCALSFLAIMGIFTVFGIRAKRDHAYWTLLASWGAILSILLIIVSSRFSTGFAGWGTRYATVGSIVLLLCPLSVHLWLKDFPAIQRRTMFGMWLVCFMTYFNNWNFEKTFSNSLIPRKIGLECVEKYYLKQRKGFCGTISFTYTVPIQSLRRELEIARELNISFYRKFMSKHSKSPNS